MSETLRSSLFQIVLGYNSGSCEWFSARGETDYNNLLTGSMAKKERASLFLKQTLMNGVWKGKTGPQSRSSIDIAFRGTIYVYFASISTNHSPKFIVLTHHTSCLSKL